jgi:hypothetical protein
MQLSEDLRQVERHVNVTGLIWSGRGPIFTVSSNAKGPPAQKRELGASLSRSTHQGWITQVVMVWQVSVPPVPLLSGFR